MTSLKLVVSLGCLVAFSSALPWSDRKGPTRYSDDDRYSPPSYCDGLDRSAPNSRPDLFKHCVCHTAETGGREYAYKYYGDKYGASRSAIASAVANCHEPTYQDRTPERPPASSFDVSRTSSQDFTIDNAITLKKASAFTAFVKSPAEKIQKFGGWGYSKAGSAPYNVIYPNFLTSSSDSSPSTSQEDSSSQTFQDPASIDSEENSDSGPAALTSETGGPQDAEDNLEDSGSDDAASFDSPGDVLNDSNASAQKSTEGLDQQNGQAAAEEPDEGVERKFEEAAPATANDKIEDKEQDGITDNKALAQGEDKVSSTEETDSAPSEIHSRGVAFVTEGLEEVVDVIPSEERRGIADDLFYAFDGINGDWEAPTTSERRGLAEDLLYTFDGANGGGEPPLRVERREFAGDLLYAFDGVNGAGEVPVPVERRGLVGGLLYAPDSFDGAGEAPVPALSRRETAERDSKNSTIERPSFRKVPSHSNHIGLNNDEGEE